MKTDKTCSLENLHGNKLNMELHPDMIIEETEKETQKTKPNIRQDGDGDND